MERSDDCAWGHQGIGGGVKLQSATLTRAFAPKVAGHRRRLTAALVSAAGIGGALAALLSTADAQFLTRVGSRHLGTAFAFSSAVSMVLLWRLGSLADRRDRASLMYFAGLASTLLVVLIALAGTAFPRLSALALLVTGKLIGGSLELLLWVVIADRFTARQARRLLPWVVVAHGAGGAFGALAVGPMARSLGPSAPVWLAVALLLVVSLAVRSLVRGPDFRDVRSALGRGRSADASTMAVLRERPLARWLAILVACAGVFAPMMYYLLGVTAAGEHKGEVELAGFLGNYRAYVQGAALLAQLAIAPRLSQRLGVGLMMLLAPLGALLVAAVVGLEGGLLVVLVAQALTRVLDAAVQSPAEQLVQNLLPRDVRGRVAGALGGVAKRSGTIVGGLAASTLIVWPTAFALALVLTAAGWLLVASLLWLRFADMAVAELSQGKVEGGLVASDAARQLGDERGLRQLRVLLASNVGRERDNALALLSRLAELGKVDELAELLGVLRSSPSANPELERALWLRLGNGARLSTAGLADARGLLESTIESEIDLGLAMLSVDGAASDSAEIMGRADSYDSLSAHLAGLRVRGQPVLDAFLDSGHGAIVVNELRVEIARAARGQSADRAEDLAERLLRSLARCPDEALQVAGLHSVLSALGDPSGTAVGMLLRARLLELATRWRDSPVAALREASLVASTALDQSDMRPLIMGLGDRDESVRRQAEKLLREASDGALEALSLAARSGRRRVRLAAVELLADLRPSKAALEALIQAELIEMVRCSQHARALERLPASGLVCRRLDERVHESVEAALLALEAQASAQSRGEAIGEVAKRLARAASERSKARALEALDALLPRRLAHTMLGAMEGTLDGRISLEQAVEGELRGKDSLTRDLLVQALGREGRGRFRESIGQAASEAAREAVSEAARAMDPMSLVERLITKDSDKVATDVPGILETIVALSELSLFAELSTVQLEELARVVTWKEIAAGESLMQQGEEGHCMYFVRTGALDVLVEGQRVAQLGAGEPVGELALFAEERRTATVVAALDAQLGVLSREDMENLLEEVPGIALQLCRAMSRRLAMANQSVGQPDDE